MSMNRQTKRMMQKQGQDKPGQPQQRQASPGAGSSATGRPPGVLRRGQGELRKVAWPGRQEVINSTIIVLIAVVVMTALIFGFDYVSSKFVLFLFD